MGPEVVNKNKDCVFNGPYAGRDLYITMYQDNEREFVVTHNANIKTVSYFTGRETELLELRQRIEDGRKSVLVSGMGGIGKTQICRKLFEEYLNRHAENGNCPFRHIGYIEYSVDMGNSLQSCLKFNEQEKPEQNQEAAWRELEYLASDGKLLLFVDNVDKTIGADSGLQRLKGIPGAVVLTSRQVSFSDEFETYRIGFLDVEQCKEIYEKIRLRGSGRKVNLEEVEDLEYVIESLAGRHTITVELLAHLAWTKTWPVRKLREKLEEKGFCLKFHKDGEIVNIQESYEKLYNLSELTEAEQNILEAFSLFPYIPLAAEMCNEWLLADAGVSEDDDVLMGLYQKGWLQFDMEQESYAMHPVFARFIYEKCKPTMKHHCELIEACEDSIPLPLQSYEWLPFIPFAINIFLYMNLKKHFHGRKFAKLIALWFHNIRNYGEAEKWYRMSYDISKEIKGECHPVTLWEYINLINYHLDLGNYEDVEKECKEILETWKYISIEERDYEIILYMYTFLEKSYFYQKKYDNAEEICEKILNFEEKLLGKNLFDLAEKYHSYAKRYDTLGRYDTAEKFYERCLTIRKAMPEISSLSIILFYYELGIVYMRHEKYQMALDYFVEVNKIIANEFGGSFSEPYEFMRRIHVKGDLNGNFEQWLEKMKE